MSVEPGLEIFVEAALAAAFFCLERSLWNNGGRLGYGGVTTHLILRKSAYKICGNRTLPRENPQKAAGGHNACCINALLLSI